MVVIGLKSQFVSLIISTISLFAEFAFFTAIVVFNRYIECIALQKGRSVNVRRHQRRVNIISYTALFIFFTLEIVTSFVSEPALRLPLVDQNCIVTNAITRMDLSPGVFPEEVKIIVECIGFKNNSVIVRAGNYSKVEDRVKCSHSVIMDFPVLDSMETVLDGAEEPSPENPNPDPLLLCRGAGCVVAKTSGSQSDSNSTLISMSHYIRVERLDSLRQERAKIGVLHTRVYFESEGHLQQFARRLLEAYSSNSSDPMESRRRAFLGSEERTCPFGEELSDTEMPIGLVYSLVAVWALSILSCFATILLRRHIFYDISNPLHWAKKTKQSNDELIDGDPIVMSIHENGREVIYVSDSTTVTTQTKLR